MSKLKTIWERVYDEPRNKDGTYKPNKLLGTFKVIDQISDDMYAEKFIGENKHGRFLVTEREVSGYYLRGMGGSRYTVEPLQQLPQQDTRSTKANKRAVKNAKGQESV